MTPSNSTEGRLASVTVTFNPDVTILRRQLSALPPHVFKIVVDNASAASSQDQVRDLCEATGATLISNDGNGGLAAAINQGVGLAAENLCSNALLLDQDTEASEGAIAALECCAKRILADGSQLACFGPRMVDAQTGLEHGFHIIRRGWWLREFPLPTDPRAVRCASLNGSGLLIPIEMFQQLGGMDETLFIDHVDTDWGFRVVAAGYALYGVPAAAFSHRMGDSSVRFWWLRWRVWPSRTAGRHYFLFRNAAILMRKHYVPAVWKFWAAVKLLLTLLVHLVTGPDRGLQLRSMLLGLRHGFASSTNKIFRPGAL